MLTGVHVLLIGGDARQLEVIRKLSELDATVTVAGFDGLRSLPEDTVDQELRMSCSTMRMPLFCLQ